MDVLQPFIQLVGVHVSSHNKWLKSEPGLVHRFPETASQLLQIIHRTHCQLFSRGLFFQLKVVPAKAAHSELGGLSTGTGTLLLLREFAVLELFSDAASAAGMKVDIRR